MEPSLLSPEIRRPVKDPAGPPENKPGRTSILLGVLLALVMGSLTLYMGQDKPPPIVKENGEVKLAPWRQEKLDRELEQLDHAEVYALLARRPGEFPCFHCPDRNFIIFLNLGEVWRYGVTTQSEKGRYPGGLPTDGLSYRVLFQGPLQECLKQEKLYIYHYALLPENLKRNPPLIRPPGNKRDN